MYPLRFQPIFRRYLWGGRRLASELGKKTGAGNCAESWEVVDRPEDNSVVAAGAFAGRTLHDLIRHDGEQLLGRQIHQQVNRRELPDQLRGRFPLLLKFLDASKTLSVQVHPGDAAALGQTPPDLGKTEAWYVMDAAPGSLLYAGLKEGVDQQQLRDAVESKTTDQVLHTLRPEPGDCVFVPAGTVHAIGQGLLIAEIQQSSDTTYRLFDWNRVDADGKSRPLHVDQALAVADYQRGPVGLQVPRPVDERVAELVGCDKFVIRRWTLNRERVPFSTAGRFRLLMMIDGQMQVTGDAANTPLKKGESMLVPAGLASTEISAAGRCQFLEIGVPSLSGDR